MKYIEIGATYKLKGTPDTFRVTEAFEDIDMVLGWITRSEQDWDYNYMKYSSLDEIVKRSPQVENYIKSQQKEKYISPITGKKT